MPVNFVNPYSGESEETCSVTFGVQQQAVGDTGSKQTEAQFNKSKLLGELGVIVAKMEKGEIPKGTKVLTYSNTDGSRGFFYVQNNSLWHKAYGKNGKGTFNGSSDAEYAIDIINDGKSTVAIPQSVSAAPKPEPVPIDASYISKATINPMSIGEPGTPLAVNAAGDYIVYNVGADWFEHYTLTDNGPAVWKTSYQVATLVKDGQWYLPDKKKTTPKATPKTEAPAPALSSQIAAATEKSPVNPGSASVGSMSNEDVSAMFVKIKDDLAKEKGLNVKGANAELDALVYQAIGDKTGYTSAEVKGKIDAYKATGAKLSALKKKVMSGNYTVPEGKPQKTKASPAAPLNTAVHTSTPAKDPQPNGVPTTATPKLAEEVKAVVQGAVNKNPSKVYSDEDLAAQYIMRKDEIVASNTKGWTLYTKNPDFDKAIYDAIAAKTGVGELAAKQHIANYLGSGKKLSVLKKQLAKQGAFTQKADTLKKSGVAKTLADKKKDVEAKADAGYTPTPTPATGKPPVDTGKPAPKRVVAEAQESGDISGIPDNVKALYYQKFKAQGAKAYLSSSEGEIYEALLAVQKQMKFFGHSKNVTLLQLLRSIDEQGALKFNADNAKLFEKKVATWLTTPEGTSYIKKQVEAAKKAEEVAKAAKEMEDNQPPLPADSTQYQPWELDKAVRISRTWLSAKPWTDREKRDLKYYTGSAFVEMNGHLREGKAIDQRGKNAIEGAKDGMRPTTEPILVRRGTGLGQFTSLGIRNREPNQNLMWGITGKTFKDEGFLSTSAGGQAAFGGAARLEIECPVGTPMAYVAPISKYPHENEMLLQAGMEYKVLNVRRENGTWVVRMRVVNWPGKE